jgi:hypothetical protein
MLCSPWGGIFGSAELRYPILGTANKQGVLQVTKNFKGGTSPRIYPWNQSQIENRKSSSPRIYPWGQSKI